MDFLTSISAGSAPATVIKNESLYRNHLESYIDNYQLPELILIWIKNELSPNTLKALLNLYKSWYKFKFDKIPNNFNNIVRKINRLEINEPKKVWSKDEINKILNLTYNINKDLYYRLVFSLNTGARPGEIATIKIKDIDLDRDKIKIYGHKTGKIRFIPLPLNLKAAIKPIINRGPEESLFKHQYNVTLNRQLTKLCKLAEVKPLSLHGLRHTFATLLLEARISPKKVAKLLGHKRVSTTLDLYWQEQDDEVDLSVLNM